MCHVEINLLKSQWEIELDASNAGNLKTPNDGLM